MTLKLSNGDIIGTWLWHLPRKRPEQSVKLVARKATRRQFLDVEVSVLTHWKRKPEEKSTRKMTGRRIRSFNQALLPFSKKLHFKPTCHIVFKVEDSKLMKFKVLSQRGCLWLAHVDRDLRIKNKFRETLPSEETIRACPLQRTRAPNA